MASEGTVHQVADEGGETIGKNKYGDIPKPIIFLQGISG